MRQRRWDADAHACLAHWAARHLPLVITRQRPGDDEHLSLGLAAPVQWQRRRIALEAEMGDVLYFDEFPAADAAARLLPVARRSAWLTLVRQLGDLGAAPRIYGSFGWQQLTGLSYISARSDLDLRMAAHDAAAADAVAAVLAGSDLTTPRLDGEIVFPDGAAVAWREWQLWRAGRADRILVKRLRGVTMETSDAWLVDRTPC